MIQEGAAVLLLLDTDNGLYLAGEGGWGLAAVTQLLPSPGGGRGAPAAAVQTQIRADLRRPQALHLTLRPHLVQLHGGFLKPGGITDVISPHRAQRQQIIWIEDDDEHDSQSQQ